MTILSEPAAAGHPLNSLLEMVRAAAERWRKRAADRETIAVLESLDREMLEDIGATSYLAYKDARQKGPGQTVVGPLLAAHLPSWGHDALAEDRERRR